MHKRPNSTLTPSSQTDFRRFYIWLLSAKFKCLQEHCSGRSLWASERYVKQSKKVQGKQVISNKRKQICQVAICSVSERHWKSDWLVADKAGNIGCKYGKQYAIKYGFVVVDQPTGNFVQVKLCLLSKQEEWHSVELIDECNFFGQYTKIVLSYFSQIAQVSFEVYRTCKTRFYKRPAARLI